MPSMLCELGKVPIDGKVALNQIQKKEKRVEIFLKEMVQHKGETTVS